MTDRPLTPDPLATLREQIIETAAKPEWAASNELHSASLCLGCVLDLIDKARAAGVTLTQPTGCGECMGWPGHHAGCSKYGIPRTEAGARLLVTLENLIYRGGTIGDVARIDIVSIEDEAEVRAANRGVTLTQPQPDAGLREAAQAVADWEGWASRRPGEDVATIGLGDVDRLMEKLTTLRAALRPTPAAPEFGGSLASVQPTPAAPQPGLRDRPLTPDDPRILGAFVDALRSARSKHSIAMDAEIAAELPGALERAGIALSSRPPVGVRDLSFFEAGVEEGRNRALRSAHARPTGDTALRVPPRDFLPGGDGYPSWIDPLTGKDKDR